jgi:hypothetical protein
MRTLSSLYTMSVSTAALVLAGVAFTASAGSPDPAAGQMKLVSETVTGAVLDWAGAWSSTATYEVGDMVSRDGSSYVASTSTAGQDPATASGSWDLVAAKGDTGERGPAGPQGPAGKLALGTPVLFNLPAINTPVKNTTGQGILITMRGGIVSDPGENGHLYLEVAPALASGGPGTFTRSAYAACRNRPAATAQIGCGSTLMGVVPAGGYYRLTFETVTGWQTPAYVYDGGGAGTYFPLG